MQKQLNCNNSQNANPYTESSISILLCLVSPLDFHDNIISRSVGHFEINFKVTNGISGSK